ncbi:longevity assurance proteins LAG1/LAC1 [Metschnikowia bicuspidata var. bicuspidata NRRL YB-4993]|uniref:Longevity assurance proteins LAG1/LAC1 n=1 Tax=Metschnikowia bicuspidata var. bicuspidata NRRL YB-4993 TaxID=869754 RepID=A0A1A0HGT3_9ASCO|nr:longevity assurance proteins LAG1/LAC1 [Metschnikowia bicuspidata var. bicuspidata NRRL YB-4993]OBA23206.1 longevity assurance proteins LAG1/LAC1 [Metschnikowia bicuspidata var. bicuspidata NRRL YB-4993]
MRQTSDSTISQAARKGVSGGNNNVGESSATDYSTANSLQRRQQRDGAKLAEPESRLESGSSNSILLTYREISQHHAWFFPCLIILAHFAVFFMTDEKSDVHQMLAKMMTVSYHIEGTDQYGKGEYDFYFVGFYSLCFTFLREFMMVCIFRPAALYFGIRKETKIKRFMEQTYSMFYYGMLGPFGLWVMSRTPLWLFETTPFYLEYPHTTHDIYFKVYYLGQAAFWVQQSVVLLLQLEKPRKDFHELIAHHIVTIALIWNSYAFHFTWMGLAVYVTMDVSDFFLSFSKTLNYLGSPLAGPFFVIFVGVWIYLRHWINLKIIWSVMTEFLTVGECTLNNATQLYKFWFSQPIVLGLLVALQLLNLYWLFLICRILYRYAVGGVAADERSDEESDGETTVDAKKEE